nr:putative capsid protein [Cressdnaviricota sp.]UOF81642.1 putative capsid protein [Cressdnaviricota sp.]UOF82349.1 putative capsid protein [Cressdnaviricota sp.]
MSLVVRRPGTAAMIGYAARAAYDNRASLGNMARGAYNRLVKSARSSRQNSRRPNLRKRSVPLRGYTGNGVTAQHDVSNVYRKKNMPYRKKKGWKRFIKKVHAVAEKDLGSRTVVFNDTISTTNSVSGEHICMTMALYSQKSSKSMLNDLNQISALENYEANPTTAAGITVEKSTKIIFQSGIMDLTVRNASYQTDSTSVGAKMEVDVYEIYMRKDALDGTTSYNDLSNMLNVGNTDTKNIGGAGTGLTIQNRGVTPFECNAALSRFGIKILTKKKYFLESGGTFTYQCRDPRRRSCDIRDIAQRFGFNRPKWTKIFYIIGKIVPGLTVGAGAGQFTEQLHVGVTRKYLYKVEGANDDRDRLITATGAPGNPT